MISLCEVMALAVWFAAAAAIPGIRAAYPVDDLQISLLTSSVQAGFVVGSLASAIFAVPERLESRRLFSICALAAALLTGMMPVVDPTTLPAVLLRFLTGACMAGIYPVGMKMVATWAERDIGLLVGILVGALTLGSAAPHLFPFIGEFDWHVVFAVASAMALLAGLIIPFVPLGPAYGSSPRFNMSYAFDGWRRRSLRLVNIGYLGHMWELYAMWAWIGAFFHASYSLWFGGGAGIGSLANASTFLTVAAGAIGCLAGGYLADRIGRTALTITAMLISGSCAISVGFLFGGPPIILLAVYLIWGITIVADSAQFSASMAELSDPDRVGTMLTMQTSMGFLLTLASIHLIPYLVDMLTWKYAFAILAAGPFLGAWSMYILRRLPEAQKLAYGKR